MGKTTDKLFTLAGQVADAAVQTTFELVEKGRSTMDKHTLESNLKKAQRQLGAAAYNQYKTGVDVNASVAHWVQEIDEIREQLALLDPKTKVYTHKTTAPTCPNCGTGVEKDAVFCSSCGQKLP